MSPKHTYNQAQIRVGALPSTTVSYFSLYEVENAPEEPGWYAWFYVPDRLDELKADLLRLPGVWAAVKGVLGMEFEGLLQGKTPATGSIRAEDFASLQQAMLAFSPPLYIGIASCLKKRLLQHRHCLAANVAEAELQDDGRRIAADSDDESDYFGRRLGRIVGASNESKASLYVKCVTCRDRKALKGVETILNRVYSPVYGRRA